MFLPRSLIAHLYLQLLATQHPLSPPVLILTALEPDALCACRILAALLKRDYVPHKIKPISGYEDLLSAGENMVKPMRLSEGGTGGVVVCLGAGGLVPLADYFGLEPGADNEIGADGVNVWVLDSRRPYNLTNVFGRACSRPEALTDGSEEQLEAEDEGVERGRISRSYKPGRGGIIVFDDGDIEEDLDSERNAYFELENMRSKLDKMPDADREGFESDSESDGSQDGRDPSGPSPGQKRKSWDRGDEDDDDEESDKENARPHQRRRSNNSSPIPSSPQTPSRRVRQGAQSLVEVSPPSNQFSSQPQQTPEPEQPSIRQQRRRFFRMKKKFDNVIYDYHTLGASYSEPISSLMYSLASELGREDNDLLWLTIVGVASAEIYGRTPAGLSILDKSRQTAYSGWQASRESRINQLLRDEVRRLNPPELTETGREVSRGHASDSIPVNARSPTDTGIRLSPEPRFLLIRHWSLYESMLHSPYLSAKLHIWSDAGRRRLHKLLAKMGISLSQCKQSYTHMDMDLKKVLRERLLQVAPLYGLDELVPPATINHSDREGWGFVKSWGWKACLSAADVATIIGAMLDSDEQHLTTLPEVRSTPSSDGEPSTTASADALLRFYAAYDALVSPTRLTSAIPLAQNLHRAILRTGTSLLQKRQIRHLRSFRMAVVKDGPDLPLFTASGALIKLALWVGEAIAELEPDHRSSGSKMLTPLVLASLDESRDVYVVVGLGGGEARVQTDTDAANGDAADDSSDASSDTDEDEDEDEADADADADADNDDSGRATDDEAAPREKSKKKAKTSKKAKDGQQTEESQTVNKKKRMGASILALFGDVAEETGARVRQDSFEHGVIEVKKEDLSGFLERLSSRALGR